MAEDIIKEAWKISVEEHKKASEHQSIVLEGYKDLIGRPWRWWIEEVRTVKDMLNEIGEPDKKETNDI